MLDCCGVRGEERDKEPTVGVQICDKVSVGLTRKGLYWFAGVAADVGAKRGSGAILVCVVLWFVLQMDMLSR